MTTPTYRAFYAALLPNNPCVTGTDEYDRWLQGALNGRDDRLKPTEFSTPAYYEGWWWGRGWHQSQQLK